MSGCLSICLYPINGKTADPIEPKFCVGPRMSPGNVYECSELQKVVSISFWFLWKEMSLYKKLRFSNPHIFAIQCRRSYEFQTMNSVTSNYLSLKYQRFRPSCCKVTQIRKFEFVAKTKLHFKMREKILKNPRSLFVIINVHREDTPR